ncbi:hypothetical protein PFICI_08735 [Pestalotiopsis fici W106-1]|uniref:Uncharacterized protein n=1 Tax=Pestalotiopsis fici (strain W106-1 / CGMCC3.15140) TaxID=1229662 RepID=W3X0J0_PESFW|nr:uncharacterized protein PFICI_08735 [Pestalotiopsis fici W106-1]ETS78882.1 hypothetical protein PFICI_08735 [Pestalotiopsis fici W106-1]
MAAPIDDVASITDVVAAVNEISRFLAHEQIRDTADLDKYLAATTSDSGGAAPVVDVIVFCASAVLYTADGVFSAINKVKEARGAQRQQSPAPYAHRLVLVLCGGIGHSTHHMHEAVARHPRYHVLAEQVSGKPEARVLQAIAERFFGLVANDPQADETREPTSGPGATKGTLTVLVEDQSTNCGANAAMTKNLLESHGIFRPRNIIVAQDPTMCRRTAASFEKLYEADPASRPRVLCWPTFVPRVAAVNDNVSSSLEKGTLARLIFQVDRAKGPNLDDLWDMPRFADLIMGEIPRLRDSVDGYGPKGKGFISHVDVPQSVETAWCLLQLYLGNLDRTI